MRSCRSHSRSTEAKQSDKEAASNQPTLTFAGRHAILQTRASAGLSAAAGELALPGERFARLFIVPADGTQPRLNSDPFGLRASGLRPYINRDFRFESRNLQMQLSRIGRAASHSKVPASLLHAILHGFWQRRTPTHAVNSTIRRFRWLTDGLQSRLMGWTQPSLSQSGPYLGQDNNEASERISEEGCEDGY